VVVEGIGISRGRFEDTGRVLIDRRRVRRNVRRLNWDVDLGKRDVLGERDLAMAVNVDI
jgi:hypothetical protein